MNDDRYLLVQIDDAKTTVSYFDGECFVLKRVLPFSISLAEKMSFSRLSSLMLSDSISHILSVISLYDRVPVRIKLETPRFGVWCKRACESIDYTQYYLDGQVPNVSIQLSIAQTQSNARYKETFAKLKL